METIFDFGIVKKPKKKKKEERTPEQVFRYRKNHLINKIKRGDLDISNQSDCRLYYWGLKRGIIDREMNIIGE